MEESGGGEDGRVKSCVVNFADVEVIEDLGYQIRLGVIRLRKGKEVNVLA